MEAGLRDAVSWRIFDLIIDGERRTDKFGVDLPDAGDIRDESSCLLSALLGEAVPFARGFHATCEVRDGDDRILLRSHVDLRHEG